MSPDVHPVRICIGRAEALFGGHGWKVWAVVLVP
jgi:hypothetical protein